MDLGRPLTVITPTVDADVLAVLARADASFTGRQTHRLVGRHSEAGVRNALERLARQGIVLRSEAGRAYLYRLNREHLAAPQIVALAGLRQELFRSVASEVAGWQVQPVLVAVFGSAARNDMREDSDIDLFVVRPGADEPDDRWTDQLDRLAARVTAWTGNDTRVLDMNEEEAREAASRGDAVLASIRGEGIQLYGAAAESLVRAAEAL